MKCRCSEYLGVEVHIVMDIDTSKGLMRPVSGFFNLVEAIKDREKRNVGRKGEPEHSPAYIHTLRVR